MSREYEQVYQATNPPLWQRAIVLGRGRSVSGSLAGTPCKANRRTHLSRPQFDLLCVYVCMKSHYDRSAYPSVRKPCAATCSACEYKQSSVRECARERKPAVRGVAPVVVSDEQ